MNTVLSILLFAALMQGLNATQYMMGTNYADNKCTGDVAYYQYKQLDVCFYYSAETVANLYSIVDSKYFQTSIYLKSETCNGTASKQSQDPLHSCVQDDVDGTFHVMNVTSAAVPPVTTNSVMSTQYLSCNSTDQYLEQMIFTPNYCDEGMEYLTCNSTHFTVAEYGSADCSGKRHVRAMEFPECDGLFFVYSCYSMFLCRIVACINSYVVPN